MGRERELRALRDRLLAALRGRGAFVLVSGADGLGKSRLVAAVAEQAVEAHAAVLGAAAARGDHAVPFGLVARALDPAVSERPELVEGATAGAASLFEGGPDEPEDVRYEALTRVVSKVAADRGLVLTLDDLHWADQPSLDVLAYLSRRIAELPVLVVATMREPMISTWIGDANGAEVVRVELAPFGSDEVAALFASRGLPRPQPVFLDACLHATGGVPLYLDALVSDLVARGIQPLDTAAGAVAELAPARVAGELARRLGDLPDPVVEVAQAVAVLGEDASPQDVADVVRQALAVVTAAADRLADEGILQRSQPLRFTHPIVREATVRRMPTARRRRLHAAAAMALAQHGTSAARRARHLIEAPAGQVPDATSTLRAAAATAAEAGDAHLASEYLRRALDEPLDDAERPEILLTLAMVTTATAPIDALPRFEAAAAAATTSGQAARIAVPHGNTLLELGRRHEAFDVFQRGLAACAQDDHDLRAELEAGLIAAARLEPGLLARVQERLDALLASPDEAATPGQRSLLAWMALERCLGGVDRPLALQLLERVVADGRLTAQGAADPSFSLATGVYNLTSELDAGVDLCDAAIELARRHGSRLDFATVSYCRGALQIYAGRLPDAVADLQQAVAAEADGWSMYATTAHAMLALALVESGDLDAARTELGAAPAGWESSGEAGLLLDVRARLELAADRPDHALATARRAGERAAATGLLNPTFPAWRLRAALALERLGHADEAHSVADELDELAQRWGSARALGMALRLRGRLHGGRSGRVDLETAVGLLEASPEQLQLRYALHDLGVVLARTGHDALARDVLRRTLDLAGGSGGQLLAGQALSSLVAAGGRPRRLRTTGLAALTPTERRVAGLLARDLTNRELAEAQFVTVKAIERHVSRIHRKLGTRTRRELIDRLSGEFPVAP